MPIPNVPQIKSVYDLKNCRVYKSLSMNENDNNNHWKNGKKCYIISAGAIYFCINVRFRKSE